jgi:hypothetical protein
MTDLMDDAIITRLSSDQGGIEGTGQRRGSTATRNLDARH